MVGLSYHRLVQGTLTTYAKRTASLEQAWRPLIPVDSFVSEPAEVKPVVVKPHVGMRWGKPADFDYTIIPENLGGKKLQQRKTHPLYITYVPHYYFENEITDFTEQWRKFKAGYVTVRDTEVEPTLGYEDIATEFVVKDDFEFEGPFSVSDLWRYRFEGRSDWKRDLVENEPNIDKVAIEEIQSWITDSGITWIRYDRNGDPIANVTVYYEFDINPYTPFREFPKPKIDTRGEHPND